MCACVSGMIRGFDSVLFPQDTRPEPMRRSLCHDLSVLESLARGKPQKDSGHAAAESMTSRVSPSLGYRDAQAAIRFLVAAFGFEPVVVYDDERTKTIDHAVLSWPEGGQVTLHSATSDDNSIAGLAKGKAAGPGYPAVSIHIDTDDPDRLLARARTAGATVVRGLEDSPFGTRGFVVSDPEGLYWSFGTPLPQLVRDRQGEWRPSTDLDRR